MKFILVGMLSVVFLAACGGDSSQTEVNDNGLSGADDNSNKSVVITSEESTVVENPEADQEMTWKIRFPSFWSVAYADELEEPDPSTITYEQFLLDVTKALESDPDFMDAIRGAQGPVGPKGDAGVKGDIGPVGPMGVPGPRGLIGQTGPQGSKGDTGAPGVKGDKGDKGDQGNIGPVGPKGDQGDVGPAGSQGEQGIAGEIGPQGTKGQDGAGFLEPKWKIVYYYNDSLPFSEAWMGHPSNPTVMENPDTYLNRRFDKTDVEVSRYSSPQFPSSYEQSVSAFNYYADPLDANSCQFRMRIREGNQGMHYYPTASVEYKPTLSDTGSIRRMKFQDDTEYVSGELFLTVPSPETCGLSCQVEVAWDLKWDSYKEVFTKADIFTSDSLWNIFGLGNGNHARDMVLESRCWELENQL